MNYLTQLASLTTAELSDALDALGLEGVLCGLKPIAKESKLIGPAYTLSYRPYEQKPHDFQPAADYIDAVPAEAVIVIDNQGRTDCTTWGDILTEVALLKRIAGTVVHGAIRDSTAIRALNYPVFAKAITMRSGKNRVYKSSTENPININGILIHAGDMIVGDEDGVLVIPIIYLDEVIAKAQAIQQTEKKIITAVKGGSSLANARQIFRYDKPWENKLE